MLYHAILDIQDIQKEVVYNIFVIYNILHSITLCNTYFFRNEGFLMNDEVKVRSFRISDSVTERFKAFCSDFDNQNVALDSLITAYEVQNAKSVLADRKTELKHYRL